MLPRSNRGDGSMRFGRASAVLAAALAAALLVAGTSHMAGARDKDDVHRDEIRRAVETGTIRSLEDILKAVRGKLPGEIAGVEVEWKDGRWVYEFRVVDARGRLFDVYVDAGSGEIVRVKEK